MHNLHLLRSHYGDNYDLRVNGHKICCHEMGDHGFWLRDENVVIILGPLLSDADNEDEVEIIGEISPNRPYTIDDIVKVLQTQRPKVPRRRQ